MQDFFNAPRPAADWQLFGSELSPFSLKLSLMLRYAGLPHQCTPQQASWREALAALRRQAAVRAGKLPVHWPPMTANDELPLLPYLFSGGYVAKAGSRYTPSQHNLYDSTALADWLAKHSLRAEQFPAFTPDDDPAADFVIRLIDHYADEFGLYLVHHNRWVLSAACNNAGERLANEWRALLPLAALRRAYGRRFAARQVRRLPYLFSVAPAEFVGAGLPKALRPPSLEGFPATHELLDSAFLRLLSSVEPLLQRHDFLCGHRLSLADAALYGQLSMNMDDPAAERLMAERAPAVHSWLQRLRFTTPAASYAHFRLHQGLKPLLAEICRSYVPLMQQNLSAYQAAEFSSAAECNEAAFTASEQGGPAMYNGALNGLPFRAVVKSFQVASWRDCRRRWRQLGPDDRQRVVALLPVGHGLDSDTGAGEAAARLA